MAPNIKSLIDWIAPDYKFFYLKSGNEFVKVQLRKIEVTSIYVDIIPAIRQQKDLEGFVVLKDQGGILFFKAPLDPSARDESRFDILQITPNPASFKYLNRRQFFRYFPKEAIQTDLIMGGGKMSVNIDNISAGGVLIHSPKVLDVKEIYYLDTTLPLYPNKKLNAAVKLAHLPNQAENVNRYGAYFLNFYFADQDKNELNIDGVQNQIVTYINKQMLLKKREAKEANN